MLNKLRRMPEDRLRTLAKLCGGLSVLVLVVIASGIYLPQVLTSKKAAVAAVPYWTTPYWVNSGSGVGGSYALDLWGLDPGSIGRILPEPQGFLGEANTLINYGCGNTACVSSSACVGSDASGNGDHYVGIISASSTSVGGGAIAAVRAYTKTNVVSGPGLVVPSGGSVQLDWACQDYQEVTTYDNSNSSCNLISQANYKYAWGGANNVVVEDPSSNIIYSGDHLTGSSTVIVSGAQNSVQHYTVTCTNASSSSAWTATVPITISTATMSVTATPSTANIGDTPVVTWSASAVAPNSCYLTQRLAGGSPTTLWDGRGTNDISGQGNNFTFVNANTYDTVADSPTNNFPTLNPVLASAWFNGQLGNPTVSAGNLNAAGVANGYAVNMLGTMAVKSGSYYFEATVNAITAASDILIGLANPNATSSDKTSVYTTYGSGGTFTGIAGTPATYTAGDTIGVAFNMSSGLVTYYKNGTSVGSGTANLSTITGVTAYVQVKGNTAENVTVNFGQGGEANLSYYQSAGGSFVYQPPTNYFALSSASVATPSILKPGNYFNIATYTGTGAVKNVTWPDGSVMQPDLLWIKDRAVSTSSGLVDYNDSPMQYLSSDAVNAMRTSLTSVTAFLSNGFTLGAAKGFNTSADGNVAWGWMANNATTSNVVGSIASKVDANPTDGVSIITYTGTGATSTIGHGLGAVPGMLFVKRTDAASTLAWAVYHNQAGTPAQNYFLNLTATTLATARIDYWNNTAPTASVFTVGSNADVNKSGGTYTAYAFAPINGFSQFGVYNGTGVADGTFVYTDFLPRFVMLKPVNAAGDWYMWDLGRDGMSVGTDTLYADVPNAEPNTDNFNIDYLSNGFKLRSTTANANADNYIYAAFAQEPFASSSAPLNGYSIANSLRINSNKNAYLTRTPSVTTDQNTYTFSAWVKRGQLAIVNPQQDIFNAYDTGATLGYQERIFFNGSDNLTVYSFYPGCGCTGVGAGSNPWTFTTDAVFRDPSAWYHIVVSTDMTQSPPVRKVYVNGVLQTGATLAQGTANTHVGAALAVDTLGYENRIGRGASDTSHGSYYFDGYIADIYFIDGQALTPSSFGAFDANGYWRPISYTGTYGTNGFHLNFSGNPASFSNASVGYPSGFTAPSVSNANTPQIYSLICNDTGGNTISTQASVSLNNAGNLSMSVNPSPINSAATSTVSWEAPSTIAGSSTMACSPSCGTVSTTTNMAALAAIGSSMPAGAPVVYTTPVVVGGNIYLFGGENSSGSYTGNIAYASVGSPTSWTVQSSGTGLPARGGGVTVVIGNYIYSFGGLTSGAPDNTIYRASVSNPLSWSNVGTLNSNTIPVAGQNFALLGDTLYFFGGLDINGVPTTTIAEASAQNPTTWVRVGALPITNNAPAALASVVVYNGIVYLMGGLKANGLPTTEIISASVSSPFAWNTSAGVLFSNLYYANTVVALNGATPTIYLIGGTTNGSAWLSTIHHAAFSALSTWTADTAPAGGIGGGSSMMFGNVLYLFGGRNSSISSSIYTAPMNTGLSFSTYAIPSWLTDGSDNQAITWPLSSATTYTLNSYLTGAIATSAAATVNLNLSNPTLSLTADGNLTSELVGNGLSPVIAWTASNEQPGSCGVTQTDPSMNLTNFWVASTSNASFDNTGKTAGPLSIAGAWVYTLSCLKTDGSSASNPQTVIVNVSSISSPPNTNSWTLNPQQTINSVLTTVKRVRKGSTVSVAWSVPNLVNGDHSTNCSLTANPPSNFSSPTWNWTGTTWSGSTNDTVNALTVFTLTCSNASWPLINYSKSVTVTLVPGIQEI